VYEDPAVAAKRVEERNNYILGGLGCLAVGGAIVWSLGALNNQASRRARQEAVMQSQAAEDWEYQGPTTA
jgi:hypothetical protein